MSAQHCEDSIFTWLRKPQSIWFQSGFCSLICNCLKLTQPLRSSFIASILVLLQALKTLTEQTVNESLTIFGKLCRECSFQSRRLVSGSGQGIEFRDVVLVNFKDWQRLGDVHEGGVFLNELPRLC